MLKPEYYREMEQVTEVTKSDSQIPIDTLKDIFELMNEAAKRSQLYLFDDKRRRVTSWSLGLAFNPLTGQDAILINIEGGNSEKANDGTTTVNNVGR